MISEPAQKEYFTLGRNYNQIIRDGSFATRKEYLENQLFSHHIVEHNIQIQANLRKLHAAYIHEKIPDFYAYFFMAQIINCSEDRIADSLNREMQLLRTKQCHYIFIMRTLNARESCIKSLHRCLESIFEECDPNLFAKFKAEITHYRQLTALVVEQIKQWKQYLLQINSSVYGDEHIAFFFQSNDYLLKILNDVDFISQSFLSSKVTFSHKQDPFLLRPYTENQALDNAYIQLFKFQTEERQRYVQCLQFIADQRADYLKRKITVKQERIKQIERAYQTKNMSSKILITKPQIALHKKPRQILLETPIDFVEEPKNNIVAKESKRASSLSEAKQSKIKDILLRGEKIRKIKQMKIGQPPAMINPKMFASIESSEQKPFAPISRSISLSFLKKTSPLKKQKSEKQEKDSDFESMLREKQLQVLDSDNMKRRTFSSIRLHDKLSERRQVLGLQGAQQLQRILDQLEHVSPQQEEGFIKKRAISSRQGKSLLQHNEEAMLNLRKSILKEIQDHQSQKEKIQQQKRDEREQMQRIIKEKLDKQTLLDIQKEKAKWTEGKDILAYEMGKKELFGYSDPATRKSEKLTEIQEELKKQMQLKWLREVHQELSHRQALFKMDKQKKLQQEKRQKQLQLVKRKESQEKRFAQIQQEERLKVVQSQLRKQQEKKREIQLQMEQIVAKQKEKLQSFSREQKIKLEIQLKQTMKSNLLTKLRREKSLFTEELKAKEAQRLAEEAHRAEARRKIQAEFEIEKQLERQRERQEKNRKVRLVAQKMEFLTHQIEKQQLQKESSPQNSRQLSQLKQSITSIPDPRAEHRKPMREQNKKKLREQFQLELFSFNREGNLLHDNFIIKDYKTKIDNEDNLNARMAEIERQIRNDQEQILKHQNLNKNKNLNQNSNALPAEDLNIPEKPSSIQGVRQRQPSFTSEHFIRFSEANSDSKSEKKQPTITESDLKKIGIDMSPIEYMMYIKKKAAIDAKKIKVNKQEEQVKKTTRILDEFEIMQELNQKINKKQQNALQFVIQDISQQENDTPETNNSKKKDQSLKLTNRKQKSRQKEINNPLYQPQQKQKQREPKDSEDLSEIMKLTVHSKMSPKKKKRFVTSDDSDESQSPKKNRKRQKNIKKEQQQKEQEIQQEVKQKRGKRLQEHQAVQFITIAEQNLDSYLTSHFKSLPKLIRKLNLFKKDELLKMIVETKSVLVVEVKKGDQAQGICFITQNQNKQAIRSLNMLHFGPYSPENSINLILKVREMLFSADPCAEITFSMYYEKEDEEQSKFIKEFQRRFDPYGAIFQKKINNEQTERKHVMRRMIGEESSKGLLEKNAGLIKVTEHLFTHSITQTLGLDSGLSDLDSSLGGWTFLSLFLSRYGDQQQISGYLTADVKEQNKNVKYLSKMASKLRGNTVKDIDFFEFDNPFEANLKLIEQKQDILKCDPKIQQQQIPLKWMRLSLGIQLTLPFCATVIPIVYHESEYILKYLRFKNGKGSKVMKLKSSLYSSQMIVIPCKPSNYKLFVLQATELDTLPNLNLDLYLKLFLANVDKHALSNDQHIWIPQFESHQIKEIKIGRSFGLKNEMRSKSSMAYTQYINNCIRYNPSHKDILVTPPFVIGVLNSEVERLAESSPIFIERIDLDKLAGKQKIEQPPPDSDF